MKRLAISVFLVLMAWSPGSSQIPVKSILFDSVAVPSAPPSGKMKIFSRGQLGVFYKLNNGTVIRLDSAGNGGVGVIDFSDSLNQVQNILSTWTFHNALNQHGGMYGLLLGEAGVNDGMISFQHSGNSYTLSVVPRPQTADRGLYWPTLTGTDTVQTYKLVRAIYTPLTHLMGRPLDTTTVPPGPGKLVMIGTSGAFQLIDTANVGGGSGSASWGAITGTLSNQTDLNTALSGKLTSTLTDAYIFVGNGSNMATGVAMSGDATISNGGVISIGNGKITLSQLADLSQDTYIGRSSGSGTGVPQALTFSSAARGLFSGTSPISYNSSTGGFSFSASYTGQSSIITLGTIGTGAWQATPIGLAYGGSGQTTANAALNAFLPSQTGNNGKVLMTDGSNTSWQTSTGGSGLTDLTIAPPGEFSILPAGGRLTANGTWTLSWATIGSGYVLRRATGSAGIPTFGTLDWGNISTSTGLMDTIGTRIRDSSMAWPNAVTGFQLIGLQGTGTGLDTVRVAGRYIGASTDTVPTLVQVRASTVDSSRASGLADSSKGIKGKSILALGTHEHGEGNAFYVAADESIKTFKALVPGDTTVLKNTIQVEFDSRPTGSGTAGYFSYWTGTSTLSTKGLRVAGAGLTADTIAIGSSGTNPAYWLTNTTYDGYMQLSSATGDLMFKDGNNAPRSLASLAPLVSPSFTTPSLGVATVTTINGETISNAALRLSADTVCLYAYGDGRGRAADTANFHCGDKLPSMYNDGTDTLVITKIIGTVQGTTPDVDVKFVYNVNEYDATPTEINSTALTITSSTTGDNTTTIANAKIAPGVFFWPTLTETTAAPTRLGLWCYGYRIKKR